MTHLVAHLNEHHHQHNARLVVHLGVRLVARQRQDNVVSEVDPDKKTIVNIVKLEAIDRHLVVLRLLSRRLHLVVTKGFLGRVLVDATTYSLYGSILQKTCITRETRGIEIHPRHCHRF